MSALGICRECEKQSYNSCNEHPDAILDSVLSSDLDPVQQRIEAVIKTTAEAYRNEFDELKLDTEWSATAYSDLNAEAQELILWEEFHDAVQARLNA